ncbi:hypothetical protein Halha_1725 [Halobacteroides halobius DSM 5150]|uniref:Uncharacterized protein n=1 Tax=Halobacteroides halobius (strain ATCC 35273 / DSM 5150 / MD-1) TaxID=748449 RepID=L0K8P9_HALHC|nr:hypothetical protein [Halobacteroides halobius]AGB41662.1 hypothetical protein Halha_1725 [Halobacteroides halobius DSM 5150]
MKKKLGLLLAVLLMVSAFSTVSMAAEVNGTFRTFVEIVNRTNDSGWEYNHTKWVMSDSTFTSPAWNGFNFDFVSWRIRPENGDHNGEMGVEIRPGYNATTDWGWYGGEFIYVQGKNGAAATGWDEYKVNGWVGYDLTDKSRVQVRALYANRADTGASERNEWIEADFMYARDIAGGTSSTGLFLADSMDDLSSQEVRLWTNFAKYYSGTKIFAKPYAEIRYHTDDLNNWKSYKFGMYANRPIGYGLLLEADANVYQDFDETWSGNTGYREVFFKTGVSYNF